MNRPWPEDFMIQPYLDCAQIKDGQLSNDFFNSKITVIRFVNKPKAPNFWQSLDAKLLKFKP